MNELILYSADDGKDVTIGIAQLPNRLLDNCPGTQARRIGRLRMCFTLRCDTEKASYVHQ
jgi:hypothetical protein